MTKISLLVLVAIVITVARGQEPFPGFSRMMSGIGTMVSNLQNMGNRLTRQGQEFGERMTRQGQQLTERLTAQGERIRAAARRRAEWIKSFGPGESTFNTTFGTAHVYNSPDGSFSSVVYSGGPANNGYIFYTGPGGIWERSW